MEFLYAFKAKLELSRVAVYSISFCFPFYFYSFVISLGAFLYLAHCNFPLLIFTAHVMYLNESMGRLNAVQSTCVVYFCTVVGTSLAPVHYALHPLHWAHDA